MNSIELDQVEPLTTYLVLLLLKLLLIIIIFWLMCDQLYSDIDNVL